MLLILRAALITDPLIALATAFMGTLSLISSLFDSTGRLQHRIACEWGMMLLRIAGVKLLVTGLERLSPDGTYVFASNHRSFMDIPAILPSIPVQFRFMAKKSLWKVPFIGYHLHRAGHIPVERTDARAAVRSMSEAARIIRERRVSVLVFPEGGRTRGEMREFKDGAAYIAIKAGVPIVPITLTGTRDVLPMGALLVRPGRVTLRIGEPIPTAGMALNQRHELTSRIRECVLLQSKQ